MLIVYAPLGPRDAIAQHSELLVTALRARGVEAAYTPRGARAIMRAASCGRDDWLLVQYMPYAYGRWGFAPALLAALALMRARVGGPAVALVVHEPYSVEAGLRTQVQGRWQRLQLGLLTRLATVVLTSTEHYRDRIHAVDRGVAVTLLPTPTTIEVITSEPARGAEHFVVAVLGNAHPARDLAAIEQALAALAREAPISVLNLGWEAPALRVPDGTRLIRPGDLPADELSALLQTADLYLVPFTDGTSLRRTTLAAGLAHGLPCLGTDGVQTDPELRGPRRPVALTPAGDPGAFARAAVGLMRASPTERSALGERGRRFYEERVSWPTAAARVTAALGLDDRGSATSQ